jgi:hypothetical protein
MKVAAMVKEKDSRSIKKIARSKRHKAKVGAKIEANLK